MFIICKIFNRTAVRFQEGHLPSTMILKMHLEPVEPSDESRCFLFPFLRAAFFYTTEEKKADKGTRSLPAKAHHVTDGNRCIRRRREKPNRNLRQRADSLADGARQNTARRACVFESVRLSCATFQAFHSY